MDNAACQLEKSSLDEGLEIRRFLRDEVFMLTLMAVVQRGHVYKPGSTNVDAFHRCLRERLEAIAEDYRVPVAEETHLRNIELLGDQISASCGELLCGDRFRIGSAQKALNLFLKYLWCLGEIPEPPHCPFDRRIIEKLPQNFRCSWVWCDKIETYKVWVAEARKKAGTMPLAEWELVTYNK